MDFLGFFVISYWFFFSFSVGFVVDFKINWIVFRKLRFFRYLVFDIMNEDYERNLVEVFVYDSFCFLVFVLMYYGFGG